MSFISHQWVGQQRRLLQIAPWIMSGLILLYVYLASFNHGFQYRMLIDGSSGLTIDGAGELEQGEQGPFIWLNAYTEITLPPLGSSTYALALTFHSPQTIQPRTLHIVSGATDVGTFPLQSGWQQLLVMVPFDANNPALIMISAPPFDANNRPDLGIALTSLELNQLGPALAPAAVMLNLVLICGLIVLLAQILQVRFSRMGWIVLIVLGSFAVLMSIWRMPTLFLLPPLRNALTAAALLSLSIRFWTRRWVVAADQRWLVGARVVIVGLFVSRIVGMWYPQFTGIDHLSRIHHIEQIAHGHQAILAAKLANQYEWGATVMIPYSLIGYYPFVPFAGMLSTEHLLLLVEGITTVLEVSIGLILFRLITRAHGTARTGWWATALYAVFPIGYLYYHDGSFPTIMGLWLIGVSLICLQQLYHHPNWRWMVLTTVILTSSIVVYVTHLMFVPTLVGLYALSLWYKGSGADKRIAGLTLASLTISLLLAVLLVYGQDIPTLVQSTIPTIWQSLQSHGTVGKTESSLPQPLVGPFWLQSWGHFRVVGLLASGVGIGLAWRRGTWLRHLGIAYGVFVLLTVLADTRFGLWNKHLYFALPGVALFAGIAFAKADTGARARRWMVWGIWVGLLLISLHAWIVRVLFYEWSLTTL